MLITPKTPTQTDGLADKRCGHRMSITRAVKITYQQNFHDAKLLNLSFCGLGILSPSDIAIGAEVLLDFSLPDYQQESQLRLTGEVTRSIKTQAFFLLGLQFSSVSPHQILVMQAFMNFHQRFQA